MGLGAAFEFLGIFLVKFMTLGTGKQFKLSDKISLFKDKKPRDDMY